MPFRTLPALAAFAVLAAPAAGPALAESGPSTLDALRWEARPVIVFADAQDDPRLIRQLRILADRDAAVRDRDMVVMTDVAPGLQDGDLRRRYSPSAFTVLLIGKDGGVKLRRDDVVEMDELVALIDRMPMRRREMRED